MLFKKNVWMAGILLMLGVLAGQEVYEGYTFFASGATAYLLDINGNTIHTWQASGTAQTCAYLLDDGSALFPIKNSLCTSPQHDGAYPSGRFQKISWDGDITWDYRFCDATARAGYDVEPMPNGNILIPADGSNVAKIIEVEPTGATTGEVVWEYSLPSELASDRTYINSISYNPALDMILLDMQEPLRKLVVVDHSGTGSVVYTYFVGSSGRIHAAAWVHKYFLGTDTVLPDADTSAMRLNDLLVVYNGGDQAVEVNMTTDTKVKALSYSFSDHQGSVQRLPNGNTLVTPGGSKTITELDDNGTQLATMTAPGTIQRAYRYGPAYAGLSRLWSSATDAPEKSAPADQSITLRQVPDAVVIVFDGSRNGSAVVSICAGDGKTVSRTTVTGGEYVLDTRHLPCGVYIVAVQVDGQVQRGQFLVVH